MIIRRLKKDDTEQLITLSKKSVEELTGWEPESKTFFLKLVKKDKDMVWVAEDKDKIVGYLVGDKLKRINILGEKSEGIELATVFVLKEFRKKGIATKLIKQFEKVMKQRKEKGIFCYANEKSINLLKSLGYKQTCFYLQKMFK
jgi:ribosomal protein S18 acetylase RimI-like enzyme